MKNDRDIAYFGNIAIGGQSLDAVYDTGSIELVVLSEKCGAMCGASSRQLYDAGSSPSHQNGKYSTFLSYGSGQLIAQNAYNTIEMGPYTSDPAAPFWEVTSAMMPLLFFSGFEAIVGLGPVPSTAHNLQPHSPQNKKAYAVFLKSLNLLHTKYSVCLGKAPHSPGYMIWQDHALDQMGSLFEPLQVYHSNYWMTKLYDVRLGEHPVYCQSRGSCGAILDSGTSLISMPLAAKGSIKNIVASMGSPCSYSSLPMLKFKLNGKPYALPPDAYMGKVMGKAKMTAFFEADDTKACDVSVMTSNLKSNLGSTWILGMPFFRTYYTTFSQSPPKMYTAVASASCTPASGAHGSLSSVPLQELREINASALRVPLWVQQAESKGSLESSFTLLGHHYVQDHNISQHWSVTAQAEISSGGATTIGQPM